MSLVLPAVEEALEPFQARPHWGKLFVMSRPRGGHSCCYSGATPCPIESLPGVVMSEDELHLQFCGFLLLGSEQGSKESRSHREISPQAAVVLASRASGVVSRLWAVCCAAVQFC